MHVLIVNGYFLLSFHESSEAICSRVLPSVCIPSFSAATIRGSCVEWPWTGVGGKEGEEVLGGA